MTAPIMPDLDAHGQNRPQRRHPETGRLAHSVTQAAERLGISRSAAYQLVQAGELPAVHLNGRLTVLDADLVAYVEGLPTAELA